MVLKCRVVNDQLNSGVLTLDSLRDKKKTNTSVR
jgi:hypothetical protein